MKPQPKATGTERRVALDLARRQAMGRRKYGLTVQANPLPLLAWLRHAYEEALDLAVYLRRAIEEMERRQRLRRRGPRGWASLLRGK